MRQALTLNANDIHLWVCHPEQIQDQQLLSAYAKLLTPEETTKQQRYKFAKDRHSALITRAFVRDLLSCYANIRPEDWRFVKGEKDKPEIVKPPLPLRFNLSHTDGLIACAVMLDHDIGVDVENIERNNDVLAIADRYFSPVETRELFSLPEAQQRSRFFDYWTLKESYIKAWGLGLAIPLDDFSFHIGTQTLPAMNQDIRLSFAPHRVDYPEIWRSWLLYPSQKHRMALSVRQAPDTADLPATDALNVRLMHSTPLIQHRDIALPW